VWSRFAAVGLLLLAGVGVGVWSAGLDDVQRLDGPVGLPAVWAVPADPALLGDRPLEAASLAVGVGQDVVLVSADGRGYRRLRLPVDGPVR